MAFCKHLTKRLSQVCMLRAPKLHSRCRSIHSLHKAAGVTIREATEGDYDDILAIRTVYGGRDYLRDCFRDIIKRNKGFVAVHDQEIIGLMIACIVDNGMTFVPRATRVKKEFEGKGVVKMLDQHIIKSLDNSVKYKAGSYFETNTHALKMIQDGVLNVTFSQKSLEYAAATKELKQKGPPMKASNTIRTLTPDDVSYIFSSEKLCKQLFPANILAANGTPLRLMKENLAHIFEENVVVIGHNVVEGDEPLMALLSIGHTFTCPLGQVYTMDMYGPGVDRMIDHMVLHLFDNEVVNATKEEQVILEVYTDPHVEFLVDDAVKKLGFWQQHWNLASMIYFAEGRIRSS